MSSLDRTIGNSQKKSRRLHGDTQTTPKKTSTTTNLNTYNRTARKNENQYSKWNGTCFSVLNKIVLYCIHPISWCKDMHLHISSRLQSHFVYLFCRFFFFFFFTIPGEADANLPFAEFDRNAITKCWTWRISSLRCSWMGMAKNLECVCVCVSFFLLSNPIQ